MKNFYFNLLESEVQNLIDCLDEYLVTHPSSKSLPQLLLRNRFRNLLHNYHRSILDHPSLFDD